MMAEQPSFDPRFDPAFQRGYEPPAAAPAVPVAPAVPDAPTEFLSEPPAVEAEPEPSEAIAENLDPVRRRVNPYVVALWGVGILFAVGGVALLLVSTTLLYSNFGAASSPSPSPSQAAMLQAIYTFATVFGVPLSTVGLSTIVGLIFFSAWRSWRRSERTTS